MLDLQILSGNSSDDNLQYCLDVTAMSGGSICDYAGHLYPLPLDSRASDMTIVDYPRWSERAGALCARFMAMAFDLDKDFDASLSLNDFKIIVRVVPQGRESKARLLEQYRVSRAEDNWLVVGIEGSWNIPLTPDQGVFAVALAVLTHIHWGLTTVPSVKHFNVSIYEEKSFGYVIMSELPEPAQTMFRKNMSRSGRPYIPGVFDAAYCWDWTDFLAGSR